MAAAPKNIRDYKLCLSLKKDLAYQILAGAPVTSLDDATKQYEKVLGFKALQNKVIVFKIGEPVYHSGVAPKTESKSKKKKRVLAEMDKLAEAVASMDSSKKPRVDEK
ncbi:unnamed protein product [Durusdinium trenchii]|uniref:Uncharacterized protein n=1 Tax=Durusdinium trenchii TaxID=1381693 RepID=A0ABP0RZE5_9DINO